MPITLDPPGRSRIYDSMAELIGNTPLIRLNHITKARGALAEVLVKAEFFNPLSTVKDRMALGMIEAAEAAGEIHEDTILVEPTSGNTGVGLAFICALKGYKLTLVMPESMSIERRKLLTLLGANLELTPAAAGMKGAIAKAEEILATNKDAIMPQQFTNPANPAIHRRTTAEEIWHDTDGKLDAFVCGVGTGGTLTGVGHVLKSRLPELKVVAVEPEDSPVLSGGGPGPHKIQGIGAGFVPEILEQNLIDEVIKVGNEEAFTTARDVAKLEGMPVGISSGATIAAALKLAAQLGMEGKRIVVIAASAAERYYSTDLFNFEHAA